MLRKLLPLVCATLLVVVAVTGPAAADSHEQQTEAKGTLFINLTSDDVWTQQMALGFAGRISALGYPVILFLNVRAVSLAMQSVPQHAQALTGKNGHEVLTDLIAQGVRVFLCPSCTRQAGLSVEDRLAGIALGGKPMVEIMMAPTTKVVSF